MKKTVLAFVALLITTVAIGQTHPNWKSIPNPFEGIPYLENRICREMIPTYASGTYSESRKMNLLFVYDHFCRNEDLRNKGVSDEDRWKRIVSRIYLIKDGETRNSSFAEPEFIIGLVYHDLGEKAFLGIKTEKPIYDSKDLYAGAIYREYRLDDKSAQYLIDFCTNDTEWLDGTDIKYSETTSPDLLPIMDAKQAKGIYW